MRYKTDEWQGHHRANFILLSPSLAKGFIQICLDGVKEVCGIDVVLIQLDTEKARQGTADQKIQCHSWATKAIIQSATFIVFFIIIINELSSLTH